MAKIENMLKTKPKFYIICEYGTSIYCIIDNMKILKLYKNKTGNITKYYRIENNKILKTFDEFDYDILQISYNCFRKINGLLKKE